MKKFDETTRYVIRGKVGTEYEGLAYGFGMADETSNLVYLYEERWQVEDAFNYFAEAFRRRDM